MQGIRRAGSKNKISMKVLLRNRDTGLYLKRKALWSYPAVEARHFLSCLNALEQTRGMRLAKAELTLSLGGPAGT
jgi:hypothetical protein